jgi:pimeloyl-ACP methyl ester carboxylesterase
MRFLYLHGFASGPHSRKAQAFRSALAQHRVNLEIPSLDNNDFEHLTISSQYRTIEELLQGDPVRIAGSSMGGYLAALYASRHPEVERLALLAPAFSFSDRWDDLVSPAQMAAWRDTGWLDVYHYGEKTMRRVHYGLIEDARTWPAAPGFSQAARIFHGRHDAVVPIVLSRQFAARHANVQLTELDSDHELLNVLPEISAAAVDFLTATELR